MLVCHGIAGGEVQGQLVEVGSLSLCGFQRLNSGLWAWWQVMLSTMLSTPRPPGHFIHRNHVGRRTFLGLRAHGETWESVSPSPRLVQTVQVGLVPMASEVIGKPETSLWCWGWNSGPLGACWAVVSTELLPQFSVLSSLVSQTQPRHH